MNDLGNAGSRGAEARELSIEIFATPPEAEDLDWVFSTSSSMMTEFPPVGEFAGFGFGEIMLNLHRMSLYLCQETQMFRD